MGRILVSQTLIDRVVITELPLTEPQDYQEERRFYSKGGEFAQIVNEVASGTRYAHIAFWISPRDGKRGYHFHRKLEYSYVAAGELELYVKDRSSGEQARFDLRTGTKVMMPAGLAHYFLVRQAAQVIEYHIEPYAESDTKRHDQFD